MEIEKEHVPRLYLARPSKREKEKKSGRVSADFAANVV